MTILTVGDNSGTKQRCDATCHNAQKLKCVCCCGGRYHGKGKMAQALLTQDWLGKDWEEKKSATEAAGGSFVAAVHQAVLTGMAAVKPHHIASVLDPKATSGR